MQPTAAEIRIQTFPAAVDHQFFREADLLEHGERALDVPDPVADVAVAVDHDRHLVFHAGARDIRAVFPAALADGQGGIVDLDDLAVVVAAADDIFMVKGEILIPQMAECVDIRSVQARLERLRVYGFVRRREQAFMERGERELDRAQALV